MSFSKRSAWLLLFSKRQVLRVDLATSKVTGAIKLPWDPGRIASGGGSVWLTQDFGHDVWRIDPRTAKIAGRVPIRGGVSEGGLAYGAGSLWVAGGPGVIRLDPRTGRALHRFPLEGSSAATRLVYADGAVWAARPGNGAIEKIDPVENRITEKTRLRAWVSDLAVAGGFVWVSIIPDGVVYQLSEDDLSVRGNPSAGPDPERISFGGGTLWVENTRAGMLSVLHAGSGARRSLRAKADPAVVVYRSGLVWAGASPGLPPLPPIEGQELKVSTPTDPGWVQWDPMGGGLLADATKYATCANLLNYPDLAGPEGTRLRPEIAAAMPTLSRDGRTYTFRIALASAFRLRRTSRSPPRRSSTQSSARCGRRTSGRRLRRWPPTSSASPPIALAKPRTSRGSPSAATRSRSRS